MDLFFRISFSWTCCRLAGFIVPMGVELSAGFWSSRLRRGWNQLIYKSFHLGASEIPASYETRVWIEDRIQIIQGTSPQSHGECTMFPGWKEGICQLGMETCVEPLIFTFVASPPLGVQKLVWLEVIIPNSCLLLDPVFGCPKVVVCSESMVLLKAYSPMIP